MRTQPVSSNACTAKTGTAADELRACQAPRCVRYFRKHRRQEWCKPSCANRARVARFAERHQAAADDQADPGRDYAPDARTSPSRIRSSSRSK